MIGRRPGFGWMSKRGANTALFGFLEHLKEIHAHGDEVFSDPEQIKTAVLSNFPSLRQRQATESRGVVLFYLDLAANYVQNG